MIQFVICFLVFVLSFALNWQCRHIVKTFCTKGTKEHGVKNKSLSQPPSLEAITPIIYLYILVKMLCIYKRVCVMILKKKKGCIYTVCTYISLYFQYSMII